MEGIARAVVLGAGLMGSQIAAHLANVGIPCDLLDIVPKEAEGAGDRAARNRLADQALERLAKMKPSPVYSRAVLARIRTGNFADDVQRVAAADWVIEAVVENLAVKRDLWARVAAHVGPDTVLSSNTSGIPIAQIAAELPADLQRRFIGTHFFNPPRYLKLLEVIPTDKTDPAVVSAFCRFAERELGKGVVICKDTPNFIANRIGTYGMMVVLEVMAQMGLGPDDVDAITGPAMGRPKSATFRTLDVVGLDTFLHVANNMQASVSEDWEKAIFTAPDYLKELVARGWLGDKTGQGFFKKVKGPAGSEIQVLDLQTLQYRERRRLRAPSLEAVRNISDLGERLRTLVSAKDAAGEFAWTLLKRVLIYAAQKLAEIAPDVPSVDRAMRWGFAWKQGPFETWDAIGLRRSVERMEKEGDQVPAWVKGLLDQGHESFYVTNEDGDQLCAGSDGAYHPVAAGPGRISLAQVRRDAGRVIKKLPGASLVDLGDDVACLELHSPKQAIGADILNMIRFAAEEVPRNWRGLVVGSEGPNFCVGANVMLILMAAQDEEWDEVDFMVRQFQNAALALKYMPRPVVVAPYGLTLGGGVEIAFGGDRVQAAAETYMGLVEAGVGLIPAGGGCKEMLARFLAMGPTHDSLVLGKLDPLPLVARAFENIATARVATSALEAREYGFLQSYDGVSISQDDLLADAKQVVLHLDRMGYRPPAPPTLTAVGAEGRAVMEMAVYAMVNGGQASEHDAKIARKLAYILSGGAAGAGSQVSEQYILDLEREAFLSLCGEPKTQARMQHLLTKGKPLRN